MDLEKIYPSTDTGTQAIKKLERNQNVLNQKINSKESRTFNDSTVKMIEEINGVFKSFLNNLYKDDMLDANVEIKVLNSMLKSDGLGKSEIKVEVNKHE